VVTEGAGLGRRVWAEGGGTVKMKSRVMGRNSSRQAGDGKWSHLSA
jgi:hypothetical protein